MQFRLMNSEFEEIFGVRRVFFFDGPETQVKAGEIVIVRTLKVQHPHPAGKLTNHLVKEKRHGLARLPRLTVARKEKREPVMVFQKYRTAYNIIIISILNTIN